MALRHQKSSSSASSKSRRTAIIRLLRQVKDAYTIEKIKQAKGEYEGLLAADQRFQVYPGKEFLAVEKQGVDRIEALAPLQKHANVLYEMLTTDRNGVPVQKEAQDELCRLLVVKEAFDLISAKQLDEKKRSRLCELPDTVTIPLEDYEDMRRKMRLQKLELDELNSRSSRRQHHGHYIELGTGNPIRPTRIGDMYDGLFDIQWHEALPIAMGLYPEESEAFIFLRDMLLKAYDFSSDIARDEQEKLVSHLNKSVLEPTLHMEGQEYRKRAKDDAEVTEQNEMYAKEVRKATAMKSLPSLFSLFKKLFLQENLNWSEFQLVDRLSNYLDKCVEITWLMSVHDPPLRFVLARRDEQIDMSKFMYFRVKGKVTEYTIWPALVLYHGGPVIRHGHVVPKRPTK